LAIEPTPLHKPTHTTHATSSQLLRWLQWRRVKPHVEVAVTLGGTYLCFYITQAYLDASGV